MGPLRTIVRESRFGGGFGLVVAFFAFRLSKPKEPRLPELLDLVTRRAEVSLETLASMLTHLAEDYSKGTVTGNIGNYVGDYITRWCDDLSEQAAESLSLWLCHALLAAVWEGMELGESQPILAEAKEQINGLNPQQCFSAAAAYVQDLLASGRHRLAA